MLTAKRVGVAFAIAILLPLLVRYGVGSFVKDAAPQVGYVTQEGGVDRKHAQAGHGTHYLVARRGAARASLMPMAAEPPSANATVSVDATVAATAVRDMTLFAACVVVGLAAIVAGVLIARPGVGPGLVFGGVLTLMEGYMTGWNTPSDLTRFASLVVVLAVLLYLGFRFLGTRAQL